MSVKGCGRSTMPLDVWVEVKVGGKRKLENGRGESSDRSRNQLQHSHQVLCDSGHGKTVLLHVNSSRPIVGSGSRGKQKGHDCANRVAGW